MKLFGRTCIIFLILGCLITSLAGCLSTNFVAGDSIIGNSRWYGRPHLIDIGDGVWAMIYLDGTRHQPEADAIFHIRFSDDEGETWTADDTKLGGGSVTGFPLSGYNSTDALGDGILIKAPNGDLLCHIASNEVDGGDNPIGRLGTRQWRSTDGGESWANEGKIESEESSDDEFLAGQDYFIKGDDIYISAFIDPDADYAGPYKSVLYKSSNNGSSWSKVSDITSTTEETDEPGIEYLGNNTILAILRDNNKAKTYQRVSTDMGSSWGSLEDKTSQLDVFHRPRLHKYDGRIYLIGRDYLASIPPVGGYTALYYSDDSGDNWNGPFYPDVHSYADAGYCEMLRKSNGLFYMLSYAGTMDDADIMEYIFGIGSLQNIGAVVGRRASCPSSTDNFNMSGVSSISVNTNGGDVVIGGLSGGVDGQIIHIFKVTIANNLVIEHSEATGEEKFATPDGNDITLTIPVMMNIRIPENFPSYVEAIPLVLWELELMFP